MSRLIATAKHPVSGDTDLLPPVRAEKASSTDWGYPYPMDERGRSQRNSLQGPECMRLMLKRTKQAGVTILDHSPALELLVDDSGAVAGANGLRRQKHDRWTVSLHPSGRGHLQLDD